MVIFNGNFKEKIGKVYICICNVYILKDITDCTPVVESIPTPAVATGTTNNTGDSDKKEDVSDDDSDIIIDSETINKRPGDYFCNMKKYPLIELTQCLKK